MKKTIRKILAFCMTVVMVSQILPMTVFAAPLSEENVICTFTNNDVLCVAQQSYEDGNLFESEMNMVYSILSSRIGVKGKNKIVQVSADIYDYYLNNVVWSLVVGLGAGAVTTIIGMIPGLSVGAAGLIGAIVGSLSGSILSAENGVIIRIKVTDISCGIGAPQYEYRYISIREQ